MTTDSTSRQKRDAAVSEYLGLIARSLDRTKPRLTPEQVQTKDARKIELRNAYFDSLPKVALSKCPFCKKVFESSFDPWGVDGLWWQEKELTYAPPDIEHCEHFVLLQGALNLGDHPPQGGYSPALTGPEVPFVAPRILNLPTTRMVISSYQLENGYRAFPLVYFAETQPSPAKLMESWRFQTYSWATENGLSGWGMSADPWDFELQNWIDNKQVGWIPNPLSYDDRDEPVSLVFGSYAEYPYADVTGRLARLEIKQNWCNERALPDGNEPNPFL